MRRSRGRFRGNDEEGAGVTSCARAMAQNNADGAPLNTILTPLRQKRRMTRSIGSTLGWTVAALATLVVWLARPVLPDVPFISAPQQPYMSTDNPWSARYREETRMKDIFFATCAEARAAGYAPMPEGKPGYFIHLDINRDGSACGKGD